MVHLCRSQHRALLPIAVLADGRLPEEKGFGSAHITKSSYHIFSLRRDVKMYFSPRKYIGS
jgi:hypothetical protein